eukprot:gb/GFBE01000130.1/.p1 GENE.gb/GFBE01000130.1/~~gb/GFBE01000130.1/.p1  ORF type:complete len:101 (+),score=23.97 gb/GFBE01000130.1/:1-303(+)
MARRVLLPVCLALAALYACSVVSAFVYGGRVSTPSLRPSTARAALPVDVALADASSVTTALEVQTPGWWANIILLVVPIWFLITLYLQSERNKAEWEMEK